MPERLRRARPLLGTLVEIEARGAGAALALAAAFAAVEQVHQLMSRHSPASDIGRLNAAPVGVPVRVDAHTLRVLELAAALHAASEGAFDCAYDRVPDVARDRPSWSIDGETVLRHGPAQLDLGGIAKGYAVDCAIEAARAALPGDPLSYLLVNAGGDMRHAGTVPAQVALRDPGAPARTVLVWSLHDAAIASSAVGGLAPARGQAPRIAGRSCGSPLPASAGASVLAPSCMLADALTKVVLAAGAPRHPLLARFGACTLVYGDGTLPAGAIPFS
ncbi:FAD:protein FMN transferase [Cupriavidus sp. TMH.W2]|uniref:FAD:protein FMN transferase n=1 Tax=Cupriavidus sp. TMH.W2 TaxID=3434465 RepID=UPI003D78AD87